jgi:gliding motility-associated-like protein
LGSGAQTYVWNNGVVDGTPFIPGLTQTYTVTGTDANGCQNSDQVTVTIVPYPTADIGSDVTEGYPTLIVNFTNNSTNATAYQWNFGNGNTNAVSTTAGQQSSYPTPGDYVVILTASNGGCIDTDSLKIHVFPFLEPSYVLPNIITPNGDKVNDYFFIDAANVKNIKVMINNRWGNKIAEYEGLTGLWDGTINGNPAAEGVYFVRYEIEDLYGNIIKGQGNVELIR